MLTEATLKFEGQFQRQLTARHSSDFAGIAAGSDNYHEESMMRIKS
jgi:hypothetical protein